MSDVASYFAVADADFALVDRIYRCSLSPVLWPGVLDDLAHIAGGRGGVLFTAREKVLTWTASVALRETFQAFVEDGWLMRCTRRACWLTSTVPGFLVEQDIWTASELEANPIYRDFLRPQGLGWSAGTAVRMPTGDNLVVSIERDYERGPVERDGVEHLNALLPHIARSAFIAARLKLERASGAAEAIASLGLPAAIVDRTGIVESVNGLVEESADLLRCQTLRPVAFRNRASQGLFDKALAALVNGDFASAMSFPIRDAADAGAKAVAHLVPSSRSADDIFEQSVAMLVVTPIAKPGVPPVELLRSLFELTPAEARLARALASGQTLREAAATVGVTHNTVRTQLLRIFEKVGCERQSDLVALLGNLPLDRTTPRH